MSPNKPKTMEKWENHHSDSIILYINLILITFSDILVH